jgi:superfamily II DNA/RNA helicase
VSAQEKSFAEIGVQPQIVDALTRVGITHPFPVQSMSLPVALSGHDIIGQAKTGTGKTLGFAIPLIQLAVGPGEDGFDDLPTPGAPQALVVVPTRELAVQVAGDVERTATDRPVRVLTVYGGRAYEPQVTALRRGVEIVVGTPGRLLDLCQKGHLSLGSVRRVVLDEADEMLDLGFLPDVERLLALTPPVRQTMLFSATMPGAVVALARRYMTQPTHIQAADPDDFGATVASTTQFAYRTHAMDKVEMLARILQARGAGLTMVFTRTKRTAAKVAEELADRGFAAAAIHGDLGQGAREQALRAFRSGKVSVLTATDVAARGIDVDDVTHVINYGCPEDEKTYLHRIGRTGRAGNTGIAVTFVDWDDLHRWSMIARTLDLKVVEPQETYSSSPHFFADLDIPEGTTGVLPRAARTRAGLDAEEIEDVGETGRGGRRRGAARTTAASTRTRPRRDHDGPRDGARPAQDEESARPSGTRRRRARRRTRLYEHRDPQLVPATEGGSDADSGQAPVAEPAAGHGGTQSPAGTDRPRRRRSRRRRSGGANSPRTEVTDLTRAANAADAPQAVTA